MSATDRELLYAWKSGDTNAGNTLFERHFPALYRFFRNKVSHAIDDLVQVTFLACVEGLDRLRDDASFRSFLFAIARHKLYDRFERTRTDAQRFDPWETTAHDIGPSPSGIVVKKAERGLILSALRRIPLANQIALELYYLESMTAREIGEVLEIPEGTVRDRLRRGLDQLRKRMAELAESPALLRSTSDDLEGWARSLRDCVHPPVPGALQ